MRMLVIEVIRRVLYVSGVVGVVMAAVACGLQLLVFDGRTGFRQPEDADLERFALSHLEWLLLEGRIELARGVTPNSAAKEILYTILENRPELCDGEGGKSAMRQLLACKVTLGQCVVGLETCVEGRGGFACH